MSKPSIHLVCNAHIDPVWLWEWEEGAAEAMATFRTAADLCEEFPSFVFNHNEAILYQWIEAYEPSLFARIRRLVKRKRWHIMGGWYLQPDCNLPSGESFVRQIQLGKRYFREAFGVDVTAAVNLDPFGHSRGLVQILAKSGYNAYLFCRPSPADCAWIDPDFTWVGFDGSEVRGCRADAHYNSAPGKARERLEDWIRDDPCTLLLWGVGNHGGGPSRQDLRDLARAAKQHGDLRILHSTPERYFEERRRHVPTPPRIERDLNPWAVGCYTSMIEVKRRHRMLENWLYATEKMATTAAAQKLMPYPESELLEASRDLATSEFHDALPGTSIPLVEEGVLRLLDHGLEMVSRVRARAFFALSRGQAKARPGEFPILVYNPHPYPVRGIVECELQPQWPHGTERFMQPRVRQGRRALPAQAEKEESNINEDHRKRVVFPAVLEPGRMSRFDCRLELVTRKPAPTLRATGRRIQFRSNDMEVRVNTHTGLIDRYRVGGVDYLSPDAARFLVMIDNADPWGMTTTRFRRRAGRFRLLSPEAGSRFSGLGDQVIPSVRVIEDGAVRTVVEAVFGYGHSFICQQIKLPKRGTEIEIAVRVHWAEKDRMLKWSLPTPLARPELRGEVAYGAATLPGNGDEAIAQKWVALVDRVADRCLTCINDATYGCDAYRGELRLSLLRSPAHAAHPTGTRPIVQPDRHTPRIDQGERRFRFWLNAGPVGARLAAVGREAQVRNERPFALCCFPPGKGRRPAPGPRLSDPVVQMTAFKMGAGLIIRLFEPTGKPRTTTLTLPWAGVRERVRLDGFEIKTLRYQVRSKRLIEVDLLEEPLGRG